MPVTITSIAFRCCNVADLTAVNCKLGHSLFEWGSDYLCLYAIIEILFVLTVSKGFGVWGLGFGVWGLGDRKSTLLNSSH